MFSDIKNASPVQASFCCRYVSGKRSGRRARAEPRTEQSRGAERDGALEMSQWLGAN